MLNSLLSFGRNFPADVTNGKVDCHFYSCQSDLLVYFGFVVTPGIYSFFKVDQLAHVVAAMQGCRWGGGGGLGGSEARGTLSHTTTSSVENALES